MNHFVNEDFMVNCYNLKTVSQFLDENPNAEKVTVIFAKDIYSSKMLIACICEIKNSENVIEKVKKQCEDNYGGYLSYDMTLDELKDLKKQLSDNTLTNLKISSMKVS